VGGVGGRAVSWGASAPLAGVAHPLGHAEFALVARVEQVEQPVRVVTEQQPCDVSHPATSSSS
jgi:tRNA A37 threonylcarbamoyltransferase TsaD